MPAGVYPIKKRGLYGRAFRFRLRFAARLNASMSACRLSASSFVNPSFSSSESSANSIGNMSVTVLPFGSRMAYIAA